VKRDGDEELVLGKAPQSPGSKVEEREPDRFRVAWLGNFRPLVVRYDRPLTVYQALLPIACFIIGLWRVFR